MSSTTLSDPKEYQNVFHWAETQKDGTIPSFATRRNDPYQVHIPRRSSDLQMLIILQYQAGFGNSYVFFISTSSISTG